MMINESQLEQIEREILDLGSIDYLDVWFISRAVRRLGLATGHEEVRELCLAALARLLRSGRLEAGDLIPPGEFARWQVPYADAIDRVRKEWEALDRPLQPGDIAWLQVPEHHGSR